MKRLTRRNFVSLISATFGGVALTRLLPLTHSLAATLAQQNLLPPKAPVECWLDVAAPFLVEAPDQGIRSEIFLTSDTFVGRTGYTDGADATEYEIYLYDKDGKPVGQDGVAKHFVVPAMQTTRLKPRGLDGRTEDILGRHEDSPASKGSPVDACQRSI